MRWLLVAPAAILSWFLADMILPLAFVLLDYIGSYVVVFLSHLAAVISAGYVAPKGYSRFTTIAVAVPFFFIRLIMAVIVMDGTSSTEDGTIQYLIDTLSTAAGLGLGVILIFRKNNMETGAKVNNG